MTAKDGVPFSVFCTSIDLSRMISTIYKDEVLPKSLHTIRKMVKTYSQSVKEEMKLNLLKLKASSSKFSAILDEWTSNRQRRYLNVTVLCDGNRKDLWNFVLVPIRGSLTSQKLIELLKERLLDFNISLEADVVLSLVMEPRL